MNWKRIAKYTIALFIMQSAIGFFEGYFTLVESADNLQSNIMWLTIGFAISFVACTSLFAHMSVRQSYKPFTHAWIVLIIYITAGQILYFSLTALDLGAINSPLVFVIIEYLVLMFALLAGTSIGIYTRGKIPANN